MYSIKSRVSLVLAISALVLAAGAAAAVDRCDLIFDNALDEEIVAIRVTYSTPQGEPRISSSRIVLPPGHDYRIGVQGTILPLRIVVVLANNTYDFADLSRLRPQNRMQLEIIHLDGSPTLRRLDPRGNVMARTTGTEYDFLTNQNRSNAVDRDLLTDAATWDEVLELVADTVEEVREEQGEPRTFDIEAGPIWSDEHARLRCPEAVARWNAANAGQARWTGHWTTTVPNEMSVCNCAEGPAGLGETLFDGETDAGRMLAFPVIWMDRVGVAEVRDMNRDDPEEGIGIALRFRLAEVDYVAETLSELLDDLRVDGYRPWAFRLRVRDAGKEESRTVELNFHEGSGDKYDDQEELQKRLFAAYADSSLVEADARWVTTEAFDKARAGEESPAGAGVAVMFSPGTFEAVFVPDGSVFMH